MRKRTWNEQTIKDGFERFLKEHGRLPTGHEIDTLSYLPSSRWIQLRFGGLEQVRSRLGYTLTHFGKGEARSVIAARVNARGRNEEISIEKILRKQFGEVFVHTEKMFDRSKNRVDFFVYSPDGNFGIDVFYPDTIYTLQSSLNIKQQKYKTFPHQLFLAVTNIKFTQLDLDACAATKSKPLPNNMRLLAKETLLQIIKTKRAYPNPLFSSDCYCRPVVHGISNCANSGRSLRP